MFSKWPRPLVSFHWSLIVNAVVRVLVKAQTARIKTFKSFFFFPIRPLVRIVLKCCGLQSGIYHIFIMKMCIHVSKTEHTISFVQSNTSDYTKLNEKFENNHQKIMFFFCLFDCFYALKTNRLKN